MLFIRRSFHKFQIPGVAASGPDFKIWASSAVFYSFTSTLQSKSRFDCKVQASICFRLYRFSLHTTSEVSLYRSAYRVWLPGACKLLHLPFSWKRSFRCFWGHCPHPCSQKLIFVLPSTLQLSWALANFRACRLHNQISRFWPAARIDYFPNWDPFTNP